MAPIIIVIAYTIITIICVSLSALSTYYGFLTEIGQGALLIATVVTVGLFASDMIILERRSKGSPIGGAVIVLTLFTILSVMANFHFIFTKLMGTQLADKRYELALFVYKNNLAAADGYVLRENKLPGITAEVNQEFKTLRDEVRDPTKPGFGANAKKRWLKLQDLTSQIKVAIQWPAAPADGAPPKDADPILQEAARRLTDVFEKATVSNPWNIAADAIAAARAVDVEPWRGRSAPSADAYLGIVKTLQDETHALERALAKAAELAGAPRATLAQPLEAAGAQLVRMDDTARVMLDPAHRGKVALAAIGAVLLDFLPFLFALLLIKPPMADAGSAGGRAGPALGRLNKRPSILNRPTRPGPV